MKTRKVTKVPSWKTTDGRLFPGCTSAEHHQKKLDEVCKTQRHDIRRHGRMTLTPEEKAERARQRMIETAHGMSTATYSRKNVAPIFQKMIRAEAAAWPECRAPAVVNGKIYHVDRVVGQCVCVTCGKVAPWTTQIGTMQSGHFLPGRLFSTLYEEDNIAPQCSHCNEHEHGAPDRFRLWMAAVRGEETIERLVRLKATTRQFTGEELVDMRISFAARLKAAEEIMK